MINVHSMIPVRRIMRQRHHGNHRLLDLRVGKIDVVVVGRIVRDDVDEDPIVACRTEDGAIVVRQRASERANERMKGGGNAWRAGNVLWDAT